MTNNKGHGTVTGREKIYPNPFQGLKHTSTGFVGLLISEWFYGEFCKQDLLSPRGYIP
ncbi:hypothetical protein [[Phormidium] sp. ETS-05]|uniref:hypothetical protein n=1 Tax=[Phormidium] sp. ETS-05 TaxID=222819 RepID=UPI0018EF1517|nr:hypothetical protein [[Phormidium] sp. ETS-05]